MLCRGALEALGRRSLSPAKQAGGDTIDKLKEAAHTDVYAQQEVGASRPMESKYGGTQETTLNSRVNRGANDEKEATEGLAALCGVQNGDLSGQGFGARSGDLDAGEHANLDNKGSVSGGTPNGRGNGGATDEKEGKLERESAAQRNSFVVIRSDLSGMGPRRAERRLGRWGARHFGHEEQREQQHAERPRERRREGREGANFLF